MAKKDKEALLKNELMWQEEKKKNQKAFYKNWKTYAIGLGIVVIGTGTGLGIYYGVNANQGETTPPTPGITDQEIADEITNGTYALNDIKVNTSASDVQKLITNDFFKANLSNETKEAFNDEVFKHGKIMVGDKELSNEDLTEARVIATTVSFTYGEATENKINLTITIVDESTPITDEEIVTEINGANYEITTIVDSSAASVKDQVTADFIKNELAEQFQKVFSNSQFKFNDITINGNSLDNSDLTKEQELEAKINFDYGKITKQETSLKIIVGVDETVITDAINNIHYNLEAHEIFVEEVYKLITPKFIKSKLDSGVNKIFNDQAFKFLKITYNSRELDQGDLVLAGLSKKTIETKIVYNYGAIEEQEVNLTISVSLSDESLCEGINEAKYTLNNIEIGTTAEEVEALITPDFIKEQLTGTNKGLFSDQSFDFINITINDGRNDKPLTDDDLLKSGSITAQINYNYGEMINQQTNLVIIIK